MLKQLFSLKSMITPLQATVNRDINELRSVLDAGWRPEAVKMKHAGVVPNDQIWPLVVADDWVEGLKLLDERFPKHTRRLDLWGIALRNASYQCLDYLWDVMDMDHHMRSVSRLGDFSEFFIDANNGLVASLGDFWSPPHEYKESEKMIEVFKKRSVFLSNPYVSENGFVYGDLRMDGHSAWCRAVQLKRWALVNDFWPSELISKSAGSGSGNKSGNNQKTTKQKTTKQKTISGSKSSLGMFSSPQELFLSWPRLFEVMHDLCEVIVQDYRSLDVAKDKDFSGSHLLESSSKQNQLKDQPNDSADGLVTESSVEKKVLTRWLKDFGKEWMTSPLPQNIVDAHQNEFDEKSTVPLFEWMCRPSPNKISPWLRLPLFLTKEERDVVWKVWEVVLGADPRRQWLSALAFYPEDPDVIEILKLAKSDKVKAFSLYWSAPISQEFSQMVLPPHEIWVNMNGDEKLVRPFVRKSS